MIYQRSFRVLILLILGLVFFSFRDFGITWDEPNQNRYGKYVVQYYQTFFLDESALSYLDAYLYGALFDALASLLVRLSPIGEFETRHLLNALVGVIGIVGIGKVTTLLAGARAGLLAALLLFLEPSYFGHMFNNPKDIPFAVGYIWSLYFLLKSLPYFPALPVHLMVALGGAIGLTLGVRIGGLVLLAYLLLAVALYCIYPACFTPRPGLHTRPHRWYKALLKSLLAVFLVAYIAMLICWPWAQKNPLVRPFEALDYMSQFRIQDGGLLARVLLGGEYLNAKDLPATYQAHYFAVKMPELILLGLGLAVVMATFFLWRGKAKVHKLQTARYALLAFAVVFPLVYVVVKKSVFYDSMRHFLFIVPCLCCFSAIALEKLLEKLAGKRPWRRIAVGAFVAVLLLPQIYTLWRLHPHQYVYYNHLAGGLQGASGRYEMDYWGNSYKEAVALLLEYLQGQEDLRLEEQIYWVWAVGPEESAAYYFPPYLRPTQKPQDADFAICFTRWGLDENIPGPTIAKVERLGVKLSVVKDLRKLN